MCEQAEVPHKVVLTVQRGDVVWYTDDDLTVQRALVLGVNLDGTTLRVKYARTRKLGWLHGQPGQQYWLSLSQVWP